MWPYRFAIRMAVPGLQPITVAMVAKAAPRFRRKRKMEIVRNAVNVQSGREVA